ncbi:MULTISPECIES: tripartite tricarboxylate transporter substrate binding protein [unclassified Beijerinckia]|uniref:Bug family tripartite tricarboxylate transporter substrate binding protein n=1 Tax=unclassified Beijerinckia TaxID=2638183 RepID=UPI0008968E2A|nr:MULTISPECIES: tripartite tricarboxylate transporter substrate binding protein [unclassified Beijerinckia]MDH7798172.1 tripartite-type tricarboxylate transporter receptor subunit TctC [Beijerinckia sp. GAS462]SED11608.1 Tripartite-type tricarboxylate transporter, receptor component TctC [Beijerinckia sp. 28-YEA-48]
MTFRALSIAIATSVLTLVSMPAMADYPDRPIVLVVPFPAGSTSDTIPRLIAPIMGKSLGGSVVIENRAGANGSVGATRVATAPADGYTLLLGTTGVLAINQWIYASPQYSPEKDFAPIINLAATPNIIVVNPTVKANTLQELIAEAKAKPGTLSFASAGNGSTSHICGEALKVMGGIDIIHVPYQGPAPAIQDVLGGRVSMICDNLSNVVPYINSGDLKAIVVTATEPSPQLPKVPTSPQAGLPNLEAGIWYGIVAPAATPRDIIEKLNKAMAEALRDPTVKSRLETLGLTVIADMPDHFKTFIAQEAARMENVVKLSKARIQ